MNSKKPQNNNKLSPTLSTIFAGLTVGVTTWFASGNAIATGTGFVGTSVIVGISTRINRKREADNQENIKNISEELDKIKQLLSEPKSEPLPTNELINISHQLQKLQN
ncbi:MAG TPA: hypothetical protein V6C58_24080, partial [Allocoleopsis sp.]